jgi:hypothetical protein
MILKEIYCKYKKAIKTLKKLVIVEFQWKTKNIK